MIRKLIGAVILASVFLSSGCALLVVGAAGGTAGYMIRKGEESGGSDGGEKKSSGASKSESKSGTESKASAPAKASDSSVPLKTTSTTD